MYYSQSFVVRFGQGFALFASAVLTGAATFGVIGEAPVNGWVVYWGGGLVMALGASLMIAKWAEPGKSILTGRRRPIE